MLNTAPPLKAKSTPPPAKTIGCPIDDLIPESGSGPVTIITVWQMDCREYWQGAKQKGRKAGPTGLCPTSLT